MNVVRASLAIGFACVTLAIACAKQSIDIGTNDAGTIVPTAAAGDAEVFPEGYGCANWVDQNLQALRGATCDGTCSGSAAGEYALASQEELEAATAGRWLYCAGSSFGPHDAIGIELAPGCRVFFLVIDSNGEIARGTTAEYQADFDVYDLSKPQLPRRIDLNWPDGVTHTFDVRAWACPNRVELTDGQGNVITLGSDFGDAGRGSPIVN